MTITLHATRATNRPAELDFLAYCIIDRPDAPPSWVRVGTGHLGRDGSINVRLDVLPLNGELHLRPSDPEAVHPAPPAVDAGPEAPAHLHS